MKYKLHIHTEAVTLETIDDDGDATFRRITGNTSIETDDVPPGFIAASGDGEWSDGPGFVEFRAPSWKIRIEGASCTARTGDGVTIPHLFSGIGVGRTGESAAKRLTAFFDGSDFRHSTPHGC